MWTSFGWMISPMGAGSPVSQDADLEDWSLPMRKSWNQRGVSFTRPGDHWTNGRSDNPDARAVFRFRGDKVRVRFVAAPDGGIARVSIGNTVEYVDLFRMARSTKTVTFDDLDPGLHEVKVEPTGRSHSNSRGEQVRLLSFDYSLHVDVKDMGEEVYDVEWSGNIGGA